MGDLSEPESRDLRNALLNQMAHILEVLESLLGILQQTNLSTEQRSVVENWKHSLPELRNGFNLLAACEEPPSKSAASTE